MFERRTILKPEKCLEMPQNPTRPAPSLPKDQMHALPGVYNHAVT
jgi:hypothetical protein